MGNNFFFDNQVISNKLCIIFKLQKKGIILSKLYQISRGSLEHYLNICLRRRIKPN